MQVHWLHLVAALVVGYVICMYYPQIGAAVKAKL